MTLDEFRKTGRDVASLAKISGGDPTGPGRVYAGNTYIERWEHSGGPDDRPWSCTVTNDTRCGTLAEMEEFLYDWAESEHALDDWGVDLGGAVIVFKAHVSTQLARTILRRLQDAQLIEASELHRFKPQHGRPVFYIP